MLIYVRSLIADIHEVPVETKTSTSSETDPNKYRGHTEQVTKQCQTSSKPVPNKFRNKFRQNTEQAPEMVQHRNEEVPKHL